MKLALFVVPPLATGLVLLFLLLPGTLVRSGDGAVHDSNALQERVDRLREYAESDNMCEALVVGPPGIIPPESEGDGQRGFRPLPVDPENTPVPPEVAESGDSGQNLADLIRNSVVLVIASSDDQRGIGTGFVVDDQHIITNFHVVDGATQVMATSRVRGELIELEIIETVEGNAFETPDLALLRASVPLNMAHLPIVPFPNAMDSVFAAGYPSLVLDTDEDFQRLMQGDRDSAPSVVITQGRISTIQNRDGAAPLLVHSAEISGGNSGGPLIDECGRVVGINTFGRSEEAGRTGRTAFYAQPSQRMLQSFREAGVSFRVVEGFCGTIMQQTIQPDVSEAGDSAPEDNE